MSLWMGGSAEPKLLRSLWLFLKTPRSFMWRKVLDYVKLDSGRLGSQTGDETEAQRGAAIQERQLYQRWTCSPCGGKTHQDMSQSEENPAQQPRRTIVGEK